MEEEPTGKDATTALLEMTESMERIVAMVAGHRTRLIEAGFPEPAADQMASVFHTAVIARLFGMEAKKP